MDIADKVSVTDTQNSGLTFVKISDPIPSEALTNSSVTATIDGINYSCTYGGRDQIDVASMAIYMVDNDFLFLLSVTSTEIDSVLGFAFPETGLYYAVTTTDEIDFELALGETYTAVFHTTGDMDITGDVSGEVIATYTGWDTAEYFIGSDVPWLADGYGTKINAAIIENGVTATSTANWFDDCENLTSVTIGNSITELGACMFYGCESLMSVNIPDNVTTIQRQCFSYCGALTGITIPKNVSYIASNTFMNSDNLASIDVDDENATYTSINGVLFTKDMATLVIYPGGKSETSYSIPDGVTIIESEAFSRAFNLTTISIPNTVVDIGNQAFYTCNGLTGVDIPNSVTTIGFGAFEYCTSLTAVTIGSSVTSIGTRAFANCSKLTSATFADPNGWFVTKTSGSTTGASVDVTDPTVADGLLISTYDDYYWYKA